MKLLERIRSRSGELCFDQNVDSNHRADELRYTWLRRLLSDELSGKALIDFGCWTGSTLRQMGKDAPRRLAGIDLPGPWASSAREALPTAEIVEVDGFVPAPAKFHGEFDFAFFLETLEHIPKGTEVAHLKAIRDTLNDGGKLVLSTPVAGIAAPLDPAWLLVGHRHYKKATLERFFVEAGFSDVEFRYSGNFWTAYDTLGLYVRKHIFHKMHVA